MVVKTLTEFGNRTSSFNDVKIIREYMSKDVQIKGTGGLRDIDSLREI
jgi:deoxyribose-phosphate aldolase